MLTMGAIIFYRKITKQFVHLMLPGCKHNAMTDAKGTGREHRKAVLKQERMNHSSRRPPTSRVTSTS